MSMVGVWLYLSTSCPLVWVYIKSGDSGGIHVTYYIMMIELDVLSSTSSSLFSLVGNTSRIYQPSYYS